MTNDSDDNRRVKADCIPTETAIADQASSSGNLAKKKYVSPSFTVVNVVGFGRYRFLEDRDNLDFERAVD